MHKVDLTIAQKGFVLIAIPLITGLFAVTTLLIQLEQSENELRKESRLKEIRSLITEMNRVWVDASVAAASYNFLRQPIYKERYIKDNIKSKEMFERLTVLLSNDPKQVESIRKLSAIIESMRGIGEALVPDEEMELRHHINVLKVLSTRRQFQKSLQEFKQEFETCQQLLAADERAHPLNSAQMRQNVRTSVIAFGIVTLIICALLYRFFSRNITRRLEIVTNNAVLLAASSPLNARIPGNDEIARLDEIFHNMAFSIRRAADKARAITDNAVDVICAIDAGKRFVEINPACLTVWGLPANELIGKRFVDILAKDTADATINQFNQAASANTNITVENQVRKSNGSFVDTQWSVSWSPQKKTYYCIAHDVTEQHEIERLKQEFVAMVSHDLRAPLSSLQAALALVERGEFGDLTERGKATVRRSFNDLGRLIALIDELLDLERIKSGKMELDFEVLDARVVVARSIDAIAQLAEAKNISIEFDGNSGLSPVEGYGDSEKLVQVVVNLLSNAIKFSPEGSTITVQCSDADEYFEVKIIDQGRGIPDSKQKTVFERFEQTHSKDHAELGGKGLGLAICRSIVEGHGGTIGVDSREGAGSTFWFRIPQPNVELDS